MSAPAGSVDVVVPDSIDDPLRPSGGNHYDQRICDELADLGWTVHEHPVAGGWPRPDRADRDRVGRVLDSLPDGAVVLLDGLVASAVASLVADAAHRLRVVVLVHMPLGPVEPAASGAEAEMLAGAASVVTTSRWTRRWLLRSYRLPAERVHVAHPGTYAAGLAEPSREGTRLLCVAAVTRGKGYDVLLSALAKLGAPSWQCTCVGALDVEPDFAAGVLAQAERAGLADRVRFLGVRTGESLEACYRETDLLVLPSRSETYAMVVTEALAHGTPVVATRVGGVPEALGEDEDKGCPGLLVPAGDPTALAAALSRWLDDDALRARLRAAARARRDELPGWQSTARGVAGALSHAAAGAVVR